MSLLSRVEEALSSHFERAVGHGASRPIDRQLSKHGAFRPRGV